MVSGLAYIRDGEEIYRQSFATIDQEADFARLPASMKTVATRIIHACGMVDAVDDLAFSAKAVEAGISSLRKGASVFCDVEMVRAGIIERFLPVNNEVLCLLNDERVPDHAKTVQNTRSAAAVDFWDDRLEDAIVVIGNAPTALFHLLERLDEGAPKPALILGFPVGFVGAIESKEELASNPRGCEFITLYGRRGGSAIASAACNAITLEAGQSRKNPR